MRQYRFGFPRGFLLALFLNGAIALHAQEFRASITGLITDPDGAAIPGASVKAVKIDAAQPYTAKSDDAGLFTVLYLLPGQYTVSVEAAGFQTMFYNNVELESAQILNLNVTLPLGSVNQQITVTTAPGLLTTETASTGGVVDNARIDNSPRAGEVWMNLVFTPGVVMTTTTGFSTGPRNNSDRYSVNGAPNDSNSYYLNGAPISDQGVWYFVPNQDAVQELQGGTSYDAQYGRAAGGAFNANIKSGANAYHGTVYDYFGNKVLNSNLFQSNLAGIPKDSNSIATFGASVGGPIRKDKTMFFASFEGFRQQYPKTSTQSVPPLAWRTGDFSQSGYSIYDPLTAVCTTGQCSAYRRSQFPGNIIPASRISPIGQAIVTFYPEPQFAGNGNNFFPNFGNRTFRYDQGIGRIDHSFSDNTRFYGLFTTQRNLAHVPSNGFPNVAANGTTQSGTDYNIITDLTRVISPTMVADARLSFGRYTNLTMAGETLAQNFTADKVGLRMPFVPTTNQQNIMPAVTVNSFAGLFGNTNTGPISNNWNFAVNLTQIKGLHNVHYGFEFSNVQGATGGVPGQPNGTFAFDPSWTQSNPLAGASGQGAGVASLLLGYPTSGSVQWNSNMLISYHYYGLFVQDNFKVSKKMTINMGLRWDVNKSPSERFNRINGGFCYSCKNPFTSQIDYSKYPTLSNPLMGGLQFAGVDVSNAPFRVQWHNWQPRVGISYSATPKLVLRAGYGLYYSWGRIGTDTAGFNQTTSYISSLDGKINPTDYFRSGQPYPNGVVAPSGAALGLATQVGQAISYNSLDRRIPSTQHWSIGLQRELVRRIVLDVAYVGSHSHALPVNTPFDTVSGDIQAQCFANNAICNTNVPNPFYGILSSATTLGASNTVQAWQLMRPYPQFNGVNQIDNPAGESDYNSLQVRLNRKVSTLNFGINYTYSNWMDETSYQNSGNFVDKKLWRGLTDADARHRVSIAALWSPPIGKGGLIASNASGLLGAVLSHWRIQSNIRWATGTPLAIPSANFYGDGCTSYIPAGGQTNDAWISNDNMNCYHPLRSWEARTTPQNSGSIRNPQLIEWNPSMEKKFALPFEGVFLRLRIEALNGANHPVFGAPNLNVSTKPSFAPGIGWSGFGTLPKNQQNTERRILISLKVLF